MKLRSLRTHGADTTGGSGCGIPAIERHVEELLQENIRTRQSRFMRLAGSAQAEAPTAAAHALLAGVMGRLAGKAPQLLQFLTCDTGSSIDVTRAFCAAAAERLGRVLHAEFLPVETMTGAERTIPDSTIARLYHRRIGVCPLDLVRHGRSALLEAAGVEADAYALIVADTRYASSDPGPCALAAAFNGTVLVVRAGVTTVSEVREAIGAVQHAGGLALGAVLVDVPPRPAWMRGFCAR